MYAYVYKYTYIHQYIYTYMHVHMYTYCQEQRYNAAIHLTVLILCSGMRA